MRSTWEYFKAGHITLGKITPSEIKLVRHLCDYDFDSCVPCTYHQVWGCPCRGLTKEAYDIITDHRLDLLQFYHYQNHLMKGERDD